MSSPSSLMVRQLRLPAPSAGSVSDRLWGGSTSVCVWLITLNLTKSSRFWLLLFNNYGETLNSIEDDVQGWLRHLDDLQHSNMLLTFHMFHSLLILWLESFPVRKKSKGLFWKDKTPKKHTKKGTKTAGWDWAQLSNSRWSRFRPLLTSQEGKLSLSWSMETIHEENSNGTGSAYPTFWGLHEMIHG